MTTASERKRTRRRARRLATLVVVVVLAFAVRALGSDGHGCPSGSTYEPGPIQTSCEAPDNRTVCVLTAAFGSPSAPYCRKEHR